MARCVKQLAGPEVSRLERTMVLTRSARLAALELLCKVSGAGSRQGESKKRSGASVRSRKKGEKSKR